MRSEHTLVMGDSDVGKTPLLREMHDTVNGPSIWVDFDPPTEKIKGPRAKDADKALERIESFQSWDRVRIHMGSASEPMAVLEESVKAAKEIHIESGRSVQLIIDESQTVMHGEAGGPAENRAEWILHQGKNNGIKGVFSTQDPSAWPYTPIKQARWWCWIGPPSKIHDGFFNAHQWLREIDLPRARFRYVVFTPRAGGDKTGNELVVFRGRTKKKYGT